MIDIEKQIRYWQKGSEEDWKVAEDLIEKEHIRHSLFFVHLALEKLLKALVCKNIRDLAPRIHNLLNLADLAGLSLTSEQHDLFSDINLFNIEGRYPEDVEPVPNRKQATALMMNVKEALQWLSTML